MIILWKMWGCNQLLFPPVKFYFGAACSRWYFQLDSIIVLSKRGVRESR